MSVCLSVCVGRELQPIQSYPLQFLPGTYGMLKLQQESSVLQHSFTALPLSGVQLLCQSNSSHSVGRSGCVKMLQEEQVCLGEWLQVGMYVRLGGLIKK